MRPLHRVLCHQEQPVRLVAQVRQVDQERALLVDQVVELSPLLWALWWRCSVVPLSVLEQRRCHLLSPRRRPREPWPQAMKQPAQPFENEACAHGS